MTDYRSASLAVWEAMAAGWDERHAFMEKIARPVTERMLAGAQLEQGQQVLELAAGTGVVGFAAATAVGEGGRVVVSDFSERMVEAAARQAQALGLLNVESRVLDAERLDLRDGSFDAVLCRWGYMLMPNPSAAFRETRRVLRAGGRLACAVFAGPETNPWASLPARVLGDRGHMPAPKPGSPGILALADVARLRRLFTENEFTDPRVDEVAFTWIFAGDEDYWSFLNDVAGAIAMVLQQLDEAERRAVRADLAEHLAPYRTAGGTLELGAVSLVASAS
jgi:SAM-dependent methyltransferase